MLEITLANTGPDIMKHLCNQKKKKRLCNNLQEWGIVIYLNRRHTWGKKTFVKEIQSKRQGGR